MGSNNFPKDFSILLLYLTMSKAEMPRIGPQHKMRNALANIRFSEGIIFILLLCNHSLLDSIKV